MLRTVLLLLGGGLFFLPASAAGNGFLQPDAMDRYINGAAGRDTEEEAFPAPVESGAPKPEPPKEEENAIERAFKAMEDVNAPAAAADVSDTSSQQHYPDAMDKVAADAGSTSFAVHPATSEEEAPPQQQSAGAAPEEEQQQSAPPAPEESHPTNQVIDITLSSELQESLLQKAKKAKTSPNVEQAVAKEKAFDVYIHDGFGEMEKKDEKEVKAVNSNKDMKA